MAYFISFFEGIITFLSPCLLPMLPLYLSYFGAMGKSPKQAFTGALSFIAGFTLIFTLMGAFAGSLGAALSRYQGVVNVVSGLAVILFGLNFTGLLKTPLLNKSKRLAFHQGRGGSFSTFLFGIIFALGWTPCIGAFLGSALALAASQGGFWQGVGLLLAYSAGLGLPFLFSALLLEQLKQGLDFLKRHGEAITFWSGIFLILMGILILTGQFGRLLAFLTF